MELPIKPLNRFRSAIARQSWTEAERLLEELRGEVETAWKLADSDDQRRMLETEVSSTLEWARYAAETGRAHARGKLIRMKSQRAYLDLPEQREVVHLEG